MDKIPRMPSKSEIHAKVRCKAEDMKLSAKKEELDKVWHVESCYLGASRNRFVSDRRRSMGNVYNSQIEGIQPHMRIRRRRRDSDPEMINIFRRQEDRRKSVKVIENAVAEDVLRRLQRKYQDALDQNDESDEDEDESTESDAEVIFVPGLDFAEPGSEETYPLRRRDPRWTERSQSEERPRRRTEHPNGASSNSIPNRRHTRGAKELRFEDRDKSFEGDRRTAEEDVPVSESVQAVESSPEQNPTSSEEVKQVRRRKRSYSDGNVSQSIFELRNKEMHPFILAKAAAEAAVKQLHDDDTANGDVQKPRSQRPTDEHARNGRGSDLNLSLVGISRDETYVIESDVPYSSSVARRRGVDVSLELPDADLTVSPPTTRRRPDATLRSPGKSDVKTTSPSLHRRRGESTSPRTTEISLSPSLRKRLVGLEIESSTPRKAAENISGDGSSYSPSVTRRRADVVTFASPRNMTSREAGDSTSPKLTRRNKDERPKPIYQQTGDASNKAAAVSKRRPLRRSRSEAIDLSALITLREKDFPSVARSTRRGSDSFQGLGSVEFSKKPPKSWNSLMFGLAFNQEEREEIARHKRMELVASLRKRQEEVDSDVSRRIQTFLHRYDNV